MLLKDDNPRRFLALNILFLVEVSGIVKMLISRFLDFSFNWKQSIKCLWKTLSEKTPNVYFICMCAVSSVSIVIEQTQRYLLTNNTTVCARLRILAGEGLVLFSGS